MNKYKYNAITGKLDLVASANALQQVLDAGNTAVDQGIVLSDTGTLQETYLTPGTLAFVDTSSGNNATFSTSVAEVNLPSGEGARLTYNRLRFVQASGDSISLQVDASSGDRFQTLQDQDGFIAINRENSVTVNVPEDFGTVVGGYYQLQLDTVYYVGAHIDISPYGLQYNGAVVIEGNGSEVVSITSDCADAGVTGFIKGSGSLEFFRITIRDLGKPIFDIDNTLAPDSVADWKYTNFVNCTMGTIKTFRNFVFEVGTFINSPGLVFDGDFDSISITRSPLFLSPSQVGIILPATLTINRRFRYFQSPVVVPDGTVPSPTVGIDYQGASIPNSQFNLLEISASQPESSVAIPVRGILNNDDKSNWVACTNIPNSATTFLYYWTGNTTPTVVAPATMAKAEDGGLTLAGTYVQRFTIGANRATCTSLIDNVYEVKCTASISTGATSSIVQAQIFKNGVAIPESFVEETTSATGGTERVTNLALFCNVPLSDTDYLELWVSTVSGTDPIVERAVISGVKINS